MNFLNNKNEWVLKEIQQILEKRELQLAKELDLSYLKPKCYNCQVFIESKIYVNDYKCDIYKIF